MEESKEGYIYVLYNEMFDLYGTDVFKVGKTKDLAKRLSSYRTCYIKQVEIKFLSDLCIDHHLCEKIIFDRLQKYRLVSNREFFKINIEKLVKQIEEVVNGINNKEITEYCASRKETRMSSEDNIARFLSLINNDNTPEDNTEQKYVGEIVNRLGFDHICDKRKIRRSSFVKNMSEVVSWLNAQSTKSKYFDIIMKMNSVHNIRNMVDADFKRQMYFINSLLRLYSIKVCLKQDREDISKNKTNFYTIKLQNNVDELLETRRTTAR
jgi:hypothetical protein